jgi:hypothetical protein
MERVAPAIVVAADPVEDGHSLPSLVHHVGRNSTTVQTATDSNRIRTITHAPLTGADLLAVANSCADRAAAEFDGLGTVATDRGAAGGAENICDAVVHVHDTPWAIAYARPEDRWTDQKARFVVEVQCLPTAQLLPL